jgi:von Willebrand factor type A domain
VSGPFGPTIPYEVPSPRGTRPLGQPAPVAHPEDEGRRSGGRVRIPFHGGVGSLRLPAVVAGSRVLALPLLVAVVLDVSGSTGSSDPRKQSHHAVLTVCDWIRDRAGNPADRIGLVRFATNADLIPAAPAAEARPVLEHALGRSSSLGGGTSLGPAVDALCAMFDGVRDCHRVTILITDGQVAESDFQLAALFGRLDAAADATHLLALDHDGAWSSGTHRRYEGLPLASVATIGEVGRGRLAYAIATVLIAETGLATAATGGS